MQRTPCELSARCRSRPLRAHPGSFRQTTEGNRGTAECQPSRQENASIDQKTPARLPCEIIPGFVARFSRKNRQRTWSISLRFLVAEFIQGFRIIVAEIAAESRQIFLHGHPKQSLESISLSHIDLKMVGGGTLEQAADRSMVDADFEYHHRSRRLAVKHRPWGVSPAAALRARHVSGLTLDHVRFTLANPDARGALFLRDSREVTISALAVHNPVPRGAASCHVCGLPGGPLIRMPRPSRWQSLCRRRRRGPLEFIS